PKEYAYKTVLLPESSSSSMGLGALGALAGINIGKADAKDRTLSPLVYESVLRSSPFLDRIVTKEYYFPSIDKKMILLQYLNSYSEKTFTEKVGGVFSFNFKSSTPPPDSNPAVIETGE